MTAIKILRYTAMILGFQASAFFTFFLIAEGGADLIEGKFRVIPIMLMMIFTVGGFFWTITRHSKGSLMMIAGGVIMAVYLLILGGIGGIQMALIYSLPFIIPGVILYYTSKRRTEVQTEQNS